MGITRRLPTPGCLAEPPLVCADEYLAIGMEGADIRGHKVTYPVKPIQHGMMLG